MRLTIGKNGPAVRRVQELLGLLGLSKGPIDGVFGSATRQGVYALQQDAGICQDGIVGPQTWRVIRERVDNTRSLYNITANGLHDITALHEPPKNFGYLRSWGQITGVTLHQTGCRMPARPLGWSRVNAHYGVTQEGEAILLNPPEDMIWHAHGASKTTIGVEIEGNYEGLEGNRQTLWEPGGGPHYLNDAMLAAADIVFDDVFDRFTAAGGRWSVLYAHRQSSRNRRADPGEEIWRSIGQIWAERLNLSRYLPRKVFGRGRPVPLAWDHNGEGSY